MAPTAFPHPQCYAWTEQLAPALHSSTLPAGSVASPLALQLWQRCTFGQGHSQPLGSADNGHQSFWFSCMLVDSPEAPSPQGWGRPYSPRAFPAPFFHSFLPSLPSKLLSSPVLLHHPPQVCLQWGMGTPLPEGMRPRGADRGGGGVSCGITA